jgi:hypothetical protein
VSSINVSARVAGKPGAVAGPGQQVGKRAGHIPNIMRTICIRQRNLNAESYAYSARSQKLPRACAWGSDWGAMPHG